MFRFQQLAIILGASSILELEQMIRDGMLMTTPEFVTWTFVRLCRPGDPIYGTDFNNLSDALKPFPPSAGIFIRQLANGPVNDVFNLFVGVVDDWIRAIAQTFPSSAAGMSSCERNFIVHKESTQVTFIHSFMEKFNESGMDRKTFGRLGQFLYYVLFMTWSNLVCGNEKPPVEFPIDCLVGKYALPVIYYVAGWTLYKASKAATICEVKRPLFYRFASAHTINEIAAQHLQLPISLVEKRKTKRGASVCCTLEYFEYICFVETVYLANLSLKMMLAYNNGDIVVEIKNSILSNSYAREKFTALVDCDVDRSDCLELMTYILDRYANMRGTFFVRYIKGNVGGNHAIQWAEKQATRSKVATAVYCAKISGCGIKQDDDNESEEVKQLWDSAASSVIEAIEDDSNNND